MVNPASKSEALRRANQRCEWKYTSGERCQNTLSLQAHHRTYARDGNERPSDLTIFCASHHMMADVLRKLAIGQRQDIVLERHIWLAHKKTEYLKVKVSPDVAQKFNARLQREKETIQKDAGQAQDDCFEDVWVNGDVSMLPAGWISASSRVVGGKTLTHGSYLKSDSDKLMKAYSGWVEFIIYLCIEVSEVKPSLDEFLTRMSIMWLFNHVDNAPGDKWLTSLG